MRKISENQRFQENDAQLQSVQFELERAQKRICDLMEINDHQNTRITNQEQMLQDQKSFIQDCNGKIDHLNGLRDGIVKSFEDENRLKEEKINKLLREVQKLKRKKKKERKVESNLEVPPTGIQNQANTETNSKRAMTEYNTQRPITEGNSLE